MRQRAWHKRTPVEKVRGDFVTNLCSHFCFPWDNELGSIQKDAVGGEIGGIARRLMIMYGWARMKVHVFLSFLQ